MQVINSGRGGFYGIYSVVLATSIGMVVLSGCSGKSTVSPSVTGSAIATKETEIRVSGVTTRLVGTAQPPVSAASSTATVTGIAGAIVADMALTNTTPPTLADSKIAFFSERDGNDLYHIFTMRPDGSDVTRLTNGPDRDFYPAFSPDATKIAFVRGGDIYVMNADGTNVRRLTTSSLNEVGPVWSPDGTKIAFIRGDDVSGNYDIWVIPADSSNPVGSQITSNPAYDGVPTWSPDGSKLLFASKRSGNFDLWTASTIGLETGVKQLTSGSANDINPTWYGDTVYFIRDGEIYTMQSDGSYIRQFTGDGYTNDKAILGPDGKTIVASYQPKDLSFPNEIRTLTSTGIGNRLTTNGIEDRASSWSGYLPRTARKLVGTNGALGTGAAGFLVSQAGDTVASVVTFDTGAPTLASRTNARVTAQSGTGGISPSNLIFNVTSPDGLSNLSYVNGTGNAKAVIGTGGDVASASAALVSFTASTGNVSLVVPYNATRSTSSLKMEKNGDWITYQGRFPAVFDGTGKNLAPAGASSITINGKTGELVKAE